MSVGRLRPAGPADITTQTRNFQALELSIRRNLSLPEFNRHSPHIRKKHYLRIIVLFIAGFSGMRITHTLLWGNPNLPNAPGSAGDKACFRSLCENGGPENRDARKYRKFVYDENQRFIYPTSDWGFKFLLGSEENKDILLELLNRLFPDYHIESLEYLPRDITIPVGKMRDASFDVHSRLQDGSRMIIEMQNYVKSSFIDRSTIYTAAAILEHYVNCRTKGYSIGRTIFLAFSGIHYAGPSIFPLMQDFLDVFGIIDFYLSICRTHIVRGVVPDGFKVRDLGKIETGNV